MSRIGKTPIEVPEGVTIEYKNDKVIVKGKLGQLEQDIDSNIKVEVKDKNINLVRSSDTKKLKSLHGLYRSLIANMVKGVSEGYKIEQELVGVGYRATNKGNLLELSLGFSHDVVFQLPEEVKVSTEMKRGTPPKITLESYDKQLIGQVAAKIRSLRPPEPYKGKGIKFVGEQLRRKAGKSVAAK